MYTVNYTKFDKAVAIVQFCGGAPLYPKLDKNNAFKDMTFYLGHFDLLWFI